MKLITETDNKFAERDIYDLFALLSLKVKTNQSGNDK